MVAPSLRLLQNTGGARRRIEGLPYGLLKEIISGRLLSGSRTTEIVIAGVRCNSTASSATQFESLLAGDHSRAQKGMRVPAGDIEALVLDRLRALFSSRIEVSDALSTRSISMLTRLMWPCAMHSSFQSDDSPCRQRTRQVFETEASTVWDPSNRPASKQRSKAKAG